MSTVIPFRDPELPLEGEAREAALKTLREALPALVHDGVSATFTRACRLSCCEGLGVDDVTREFVDAVCRELARVGRGVLEPLLSDRPPP